MDSSETHKLIIGGDRAPMAGMVFEIDDVTFAEPSPDKRFLSFVARMQDDGTEYGWAAQMLLTGWEQDKMGNVPVYRGDLRFLAVPDLTANFVDALEKSFGLDQNGDGHFGKLFCDCAAFVNDPVEIENKEFVGRIFFGDGSPPESDVSVFMTLNLREGRVWFSEKDTSYRKGLVSWFRGDFQ